jgi:hypothetical protein
MGFYRALDSQTLLGLTGNQTTETVWTDVVEVRGAFASSGAPGGWTLKIVDDRGGIRYEEDMDGTVRFVDAENKPVEDVAVQITQDGVTHHIENFDEIRWTV